MRNVFAGELEEIAVRDPRVILLTGDIGNRLFDDYQARFQERFVNCGIAEANMIGVAGGLAMGGYRPVVYTIAPFLTLRCLEQIRIDLCYHAQPVVLVGTGAGLSYASLGPTHHSLDDLAALRVLPGMTILAPGDPWELRLALRSALRHDGPSYIRIGKKGEPEQHACVPEGGIGASVTLRRGRDATIIAVGTILDECVHAAQSLESDGWSVGVESMFSVKPMNERRLEELFSANAVVAIVEEHSIIGGAAAAISQWLATRRTSGVARLVCLGVADEFLHATGTTGWMRAHVGIDRVSIAKKVPMALEEVRTGSRE